MDRRKKFQRVMALVLAGATVLTLLISALIYLISSLS